MSWIATVLDAIVGFLISLYKSPVAKTVFKVIAETVEDLPPDLWSKVLSLVGKAALLDGDGREKFYFVYDALKKEYPDLPENTLRSLIENALLVTKKGAA